MEAEYSSPLSQGHTTYRYPQPDQNTVCYPILFLEDPFNIILPSAPVSSKWSLSFKVSHQKHMEIYRLPFTCRRACLAHPPSFNKQSN
jgi:hypothetical protein